MKILIVNGIGNNVVESIRSLYEDGNQIDIAIPTSKRNLGLQKYFLSNKIYKYYLVERPLIHMDAFTKQILEIVKNEKYDVVLPYGFETTVALAQIQKELQPFIATCIADYETVAMVHDKERLTITLHANGFDVPKIYAYTDFKELRKQSIEFPVVVKATKGCGIAEGVRYANNHEELEQSYKEITQNETLNSDLKDFSKPMIQEYIPGKIYDGLFLCNHGEIIASMAQIRDVTYPLSGGVGVNNITIQDDKLLEYCSNILKFIKWHGPCQVEVKKDTRSGTYKLIEINPKLWGTVGLSIKAGIDFPLLTCQLAVKKIVYKHDYKIGMKYKIIFPLEIYTIYQDKGNRFKRFKKLFEIFCQNVKTEFDWKDIKPNIFNILMTLKTICFQRNKILPKGKSYFDKDSR